MARAEVRSAQRAARGRRHDHVRPRAVPRVRGRARGARRARARDGQVPGVPRAHTGAARRFALDFRLARARARALAGVARRVARSRRARPLHDEGGRGRRRLGRRVARAAGLAGRAPSTAPAESDERRAVDGSHPELLDPYWMNVAELRDELGHRGLDVTGRKPQLVERLEAARARDGPTVRLNAGAPRLESAGQCAECGGRAAPWLPSSTSTTATRAATRATGACCACRGAPRREITGRASRTRRSVRARIERFSSARISDVEARLVVDDESDAESDDDSDAERARSLGEQPLDAAGRAADEGRGPAIRASSLGRGQTVAEGGARSAARGDTP